MDIFNFDQAETNMMREWAEEKVQFWTNLLEFYSIPGGIGFDDSDIINCEIKLATARRIAETLA